MACWCRTSRAGLSRARSLHTPASPRTRELKRRAERRLWSPPGGRVEAGPGECSLPRASSLLDPKLAFGPTDPFVIPAQVADDCLYPGIHDLDFAPERGLPYIPY